MRKSLIAALCFTVCITHGLAASRVALVIGVNSYRQLPENHQLTSPVNDAKDVAAALAGLGYTLITGAAVTEADREGITTATEAFAHAARGAEAAVFYFSGHGIQVGEDNYLLPADTPRLTGYSVLKNRAVLLRDSVMTALEEAAVPNKVIILDCCRDNPFSAQLESALSQVGKSLRTKSVGEITGYGPGFYLAFATSPGQRADDGNGARNSPFTEALLKAVPSSAGKDIDFFFRDVKTHLSAEQVSWTNHSLKETFSLAPGSSGAAGGMVKSSPQANPVPESASSLFDQGSVGKGIQIKLPGDVPLIFRYCPPGSFTMGSPPIEKDRRNDENQVQVSLSQGFWMGQTEVTQAQWKSLMGTTPDQQKASGEEGKTYGDVNGLGADHPMYFVSWEDAQAFITKLNQTAPPPVGWQYALPTEAQWEYACRAGTESVFHFGDGLSGEQANMDGNTPYGTSTKGPYLEKTCPIGSYPANAWGLHDMHGNVWEWCADWYAEKLVGGTNPPGASSGVIRVNRGGSWGSIAARCRAANRYDLDPGYRGGNLGFRPALVPSSK